MPYRRWIHSCCTDHPNITCGPTCSRCNELGRFHGWALTPDERAELYREVLGLEAFGPHQLALHDLIGRARSTCEPCRGNGVTGDEYGWTPCRACEGGGGAWVAAEETIRDGYRRLLKEYPSAAIPGARLPFGMLPATRVRRQRVAAGVVPARSAPALDRERAALTDVQLAFVGAERKLGTRWTLKGRERCARVTLKASVSREVSRVSTTWQVVTPQGTGSGRRLFPLAIVLEAARILGVDASELIGKEYP
jgi:hypothetical protein